MAHLTDERGNPIQLTDEYGNPVTLTDEHGNPMHLRGVAYSTGAPTPPTIATTTTVGEIIGGVSATAEGYGRQVQPRRVDEEIRRTSSSSSTSSEEEIVGEGGYVEGEEGGTRCRKKGITQKIKEKLSLGGPKTKDKDTTAAATTTTTTETSSPHKIATTDTTTQRMMVEHVEEEKGGTFVASDTTTTTVTTEHRDQAKKGVMEKIMEKLPGHH